MFDDTKNSQDSVENNQGPSLKDIAKKRYNVGNSGGSFYNNHSYEDLVRYAEADAEATYQFLKNLSVPDYGIEGCEIKLYPVTIIEGGINQGKSLAASRIVLSALRKKKNVLWVFGASLGAAISKLSLVSLEENLEGADFLSRLHVAKDSLDLDIIEDSAEDFDLVVFDETGDPWGLRFSVRKFKNANFVWVRSGDRKEPDWNVRKEDKISLSSSVKHLSSGTVFNYHFVSSDNVRDYYVDVKGRQVEFNYSELLGLEGVRRPGERIPEKGVESQMDSRFMDVIKSFYFEGKDPSGRNDV